MKKKLLFIVWALMSLSLMAQQKEAVTMVKFEQSWLDSEASISLRNNTQAVIETIRFQLVFYDMDGQQIDYKKYTLNKSIDPGMARIFKIPAFQHDRQYHYYRTKNPLGSPLFKWNISCCMRAVPPQKLRQSPGSLLRREHLQNLPLLLPAKQPDSLQGKLPYSPMRIQMNMSSPMQMNHASHWSMHLRRFLFSFYGQSLCSLSLFRSLS